MGNGQLKCSNCELAAVCKTPCMPPDESGLIDGACDVLIIGEAPGAEEDIVGTPFVGPSGALLRGIVEDVGLDAYSLVYTNVVCCRPPENKIAAKHIKACTPRLLAEIEHYSPKLIILLGNTPLKAALGESGITAWRGSKLDRDGKTYLPTFHPSYILRNNNELPTLLKDIQAAYDLLANGGEQSLVEGYQAELVVGEEDALEMQLHILAAGKVAWDTESRNAKPYAPGARMIMLSFAVDKPEKRAWAVVPDNPVVAEMCKTILTSEHLKILCHNAKYDQHVVSQAWGIDVPGVVGDSMLASWLLDTTPGRHGLKHLAGRLLNLYEYNSELDAYHAKNPKSNPENEGGDQALVPLEILAPYAAMDAIATLEIHKRLYKQLDKTQRVLYNELIIPLSHALQRMERNGVALDTYIVNRYIKVYTDIQQHQMELMLEDAVVQKFIKAQQRQLDADFDAKYAGKKTRAKRPVFTFNPNSDVQMRKLLFDRRYMRLPVLGKTEGGEPSTKWDYLKPLANDNPFLKTFRYYNLLDKMLSTYLRPAFRWQGADGRVRSTYKIHGTVSGRLSSAEPNLQNIPTPEKEPDTVLAFLPVKNIFTCSDWATAYPEEWQAWLDSASPAEIAHWQEMLGPYFDKGGVVMSADYSGMELRVMVSESGCKGMMEIFLDGGDVHRVVSSKIFGIPPEEITKEQRYRGKWTSWTLMYGGDEHTLENLYGIPLEQGQQFMEAYFEAFPEIKVFQEDTKQFAHDNGYVESMFGQRRYLPYINDPSRYRQAEAEREAMNHPIQSVASQMLDMALIILDDVLRWNDVKAMMVNTVHDSIMIDCPLWEVRDVAHLIKQVMEGLKELYKTWFPNMDLEWFTCPLVVDIEVGSHYGSLQELKED